MEILCVTDGVLWCCYWVFYLMNDLRRVNNVITRAGNLPLQLERYRRDTRIERDNAISIGLVYQCFRM